MARKKRQRSASPAAPSAATSLPDSAAGDARAHPEWHWRTFPVFCAFVVGLLAASFINGRPNNSVAAIVQIASLLGLGYCLAHLFVMNVVVAGRIKRRREAAERGEELDEDFEEELVYPDDPAAPSP